MQYAPPDRRHAAQCAVAAHGSRREAARDATLGPPWPNRPAEAAPGVQKQKSRLFCNFFAIRDCSELSNQGLRCKSAGKSVSLRPVFALRGWK